MALGILEIIALVLKVFIELWTNRTDPVLARSRAAAAASRELSDDLTEFDKALATNDADAISNHFELLRRRVSAATSGSDSKR